jgi:hypothetical protein
LGPKGGVELPQANQQRTLEGKDFLAWERKVTLRLFAYKIAPV